MYIHIYISIYLSSMRKPILLEIQFEFELVETTTKNHNKQKNKNTKKTMFWGTTSGLLGSSHVQTSLETFF